MKTKILFIALLFAQLVSGQFGDQLLKKEISKYSFESSELSSLKEYGKCAVTCYDSEVFNPSMDDSTFSVSHGTPTFNSQGIWMWSYNSNGTILGEGVYTPYTFKRGKQYCVEMEVVLSRTGTTQAINPNATFNVTAARNITPRNDFQIPNVVPRQSIISERYSNYPLNTPFIIRRTFTASLDFNELWLHPRNPGAPHPQLNMLVRNVKIKRAVSCPCKIEGNIDFKKRENCEYQFFATANPGNSSTRIIGYLWNFGDGNTSTEQNPIHPYSSNGVYYVTLTVYGVNDDGECCTRVFKTKVFIKNDCPQECEVDAGFKVIKKGWWFTSSCDFINTSTSNAFTTILGYEWYVDGVLVSTDKDVKNYRGRGKQVCLKVYGIDKKGNCCQDEYCYRIRK